MQSTDHNRMQDAENVVGRFAPSPSGRMHLGNVYAALVAWLSARSQGGRMVLRIEDLDERCRRGRWDGQLISDLRWLGLDWDEGPIYQSDRIDLYEHALSRLADAGLVYPCFCTRAELHAASAPHASDGTPRYPGTCRNLSAAEASRRAEERSLVYPCFCTRAELHAASAPHASDGTPRYPGTCRNLSAAEASRRAEERSPAMRLAVPDAADPRGSIDFEDRTYGTQREVLAEECGDFLVRRSDGVFAYQLVVVVDDAEMGVTEVVRGRDLLGSSARQMYLQDLLGYPHPSYAHVPLLVAPDGRRLSKRDRDCDMHELKARYGEPMYLQDLLGYPHPSYAHVPLLVAPDGRRLSKRDRDCDMHELKARYGEPERLLGEIAYLAGIAPDPRPRSAEKLADLFSWNAIRDHRADLAIE